MAKKNLIDVTDAYYSLNKESVLNLEMSEDPEYLQCVYIDNQAVVSVGSMEEAYGNGDAMIAGRLGNFVDGQSLRSWLGKDENQQFMQEMYDDVMKERKRDPDESSAVEEVDERFTMTLYREVNDLRLVSNDELIKRMDAGSIDSENYDDLADELKENVSEKETWDGEGNLEHELWEHFALDTNNPIPTSLLDATMERALIELSDESEVFQRVVDSGLDVNATDGNSETWLHRAVDVRQDTAALILLGAGVDFEAESGFGKTAEQIAAFNGDDSIVEAIQARRAEVSKQSITRGLNDSWSPDTDDGKRLLEKLSASAPATEAENHQARRKM